MADSEEKPRKKAGRKPKVPQTEVIKAFKGSGGIYTTVARRCGCSPQTVENYVKKYDKVAKARKQALDETKDLCENRLLKAIDAGERWAIEFYLKKQAKDRGYGDNESDITIKGIEVVFKDEENKK